MSVEKKVVLVADDEPDAITFVRNVLEDDFTVVAVGDGVAAVKKAKEVSPALAILDVQMPGQDGFATFGEMRNDPATRSIPVILLTAVTKRTGLKFSADDVNEYMGERPDAYLEKPIDPAKLLGLVRQLVGE